MKKILLTIGALMLPVITFAQNDNQVVTLLVNLRKWLNIIIPILIIVAVVYFIWGVIQYVVMSKGDEEAQAAARNKIVYGLIGIFVILSVYGLVFFLGRTLGIGQGGSAPVPCVTGTYDPVLGVCR
jgi:hypothetical protein